MLGSSAMAQDVSVLVLDASGSMWNRMEGDASRIEVARKVMADYLAARDAATPLAVLAYGHRRRGDCGDIEVVAPMALQDPELLSDRISALNPLGMTPLTESLRRARDQIPATAESADVVLITDGLENCGSDPCALAAQLAAEGIPIRAHVVGFGMTRDEVGALSCLPDTTGGLLLSAANGAELAAALEQVDQSVSAPEFAFIAVDAATGEPLGAADWIVRDAAGAEVASARNSNRFAPELPEGAYAIEAQRPGFAGRMELTVETDTTGIIEIALAEDLPEATLSAADAATAGTELQVDWSGPDAEGDRIVLAAPEAEPDGSVERTLTRWGSPATLRLPDETGAYELRYVQADPLRILAARPLALVAGAAAIEDPGMVVPSERFEVVWTGPAGQGDEIVLAAPDMADDERITATQTRWGSPSRLKAPDTPGRYELRYRVRASGRILTRQSVIVGEPE
jgi:Ca-activated chloride channel family protein